MQERILIAPLDWGMGHATRCVPIIRGCLERGHEVILATNGRSADFLRRYFPQLTFLHDIPDYDISYPQSGSFTWYFIKETPRLFKIIRAEKLWLERIIKEHSITKVISDNRYGLYAKNIPSILVTHQLNIQVSGIWKSAVNAVLKHYISPFNEVIIPDNSDKNSFAGKLVLPSFKVRNLRYIGPLSRFENIEVSKSIKFKFVAIVSGPEPQRTFLQNRLLEIFKELKQPSVILCGLPDGLSEVQDENVMLVSHADDARFLQLVSSSENIICRSGYSTLMDLMALNRKALLIATPGQIEQEYLAQRFQEKFGFSTIHQSEISVERIASKFQ